MVSLAAGYGRRFLVPPRKQQNQAQADQVIAAMKGAAIQGSGVSVEVQNGVAILDGKVNKASDRALAQRLAQSVPGIESVENNLRFMPDARGQVQQHRVPRHADLFESRVTQAGLTESETGGSGIRQVSDETPSVAAPATQTAIKATPVRAAIFRLGTGQSGCGSADR